MTRLRPVSATRALGVTDDVGNRASPISSLEVAPARSPASSAPTRRQDHDLQRITGAYAPTLGGCGSTARHQPPILRTGSRVPAFRRTFQNIRLFADMTVWEHHFFFFGGATSIPNFRLRPLAADSVGPIRVRAPAPNRFSTSSNSRRQGSPGRALPYCNSAPLEGPAVTARQAAAAGRAGRRHEHYEPTNPAADAKAGARGPEHSLDFGGTPWPSS